MYVPDRYRETNTEAIRDFVARYPFATIVTAPGELPRATHLPLILDHLDGEDVLIGHLARANPQWRDFDGARPAVAIFDRGPHAYISPRWYGLDQAVPTWNYVSVHMEGVPVVLDDPAVHRAAVRALTERFESSDGYSMDALPADYLDAMLQATVAFRMRVTRTDASFKLGQNRPPAARRGAVDALSGAEDSAAREIARLMQERLPQD